MILWIPDHLLFQVSRAIGDGEYKPYVTAQPDITTIKRNGTEDFIIGSHVQMRCCFDANICEHQWPVTDSGTQLRLKKQQGVYCCWLILYDYL